MMKRLFVVCVCVVFCAAGQCEDAAQPMVEMMNDGPPPDTQPTPQTQPPPPEDNPDPLPIVRPGQPLPFLTQEQFDIFVSFYTPRENQIRSALPKGFSTARITLVPLELIRSFDICNYCHGDRSRIACIAVTVQADSDCMHGEVSIRI